MDDRAAQARPARPRPGAAVVPRIRRPAAAPDAAALVAALWRDRPPDGWVGGRPAAAAGRAECDALATVAARAARLAERGPAAGRAAARLLAETAQVVAEALVRELARGGAPAAPPPPLAAGDALASPVRLRLARMERWLAGRAAEDPDAGPAADLCLWALELLEADGH